MKESWKNLIKVRKRGEKIKTQSTESKPKTTPQDLKTDLNKAKSSQRIKNLLAKAENQQQESGQNIELLLPNANKSDRKFTTEPIPDSNQQAIRCGLEPIKNLNDQQIKTVIENRPYNLAIEEQSHFSSAVGGLSFEVAFILKRIGAFRDDWYQPHREFKKRLLAIDGTYPFPLWNTKIQQAKKLADHYEVTFSTVEELEIGVDLDAEVFLRGVLSDVDRREISDLESMDSEWRPGSRYAVVNLIDSTGSVQVKFEPDKFKEFESGIDVGERVLVEAERSEEQRTGSGGELIGKYLMTLDWMTIREHQSKYGG